MPLGLHFLNGDVSTACLSAPARDEDGRKGWMRPSARMPSRTTGVPGSSPGGSLIGGRSSAGRALFSTPVVALICRNDPTIPSLLRAEVAQRQRPHAQDVTGAGSNPALGIRPDSPTWQRHRIESPAGAGSNPAPGTTRVICKLASTSTSFLCAEEGIWS